MGYKRLIRKMASFILNSQPDKKVIIKTSQIDYHSLFKNKHVVVTGGSKGIGFAIAKKCVSEGATVVITGRNQKKLDDARMRLGERCYAISFDATDIENSSKFLEQAVDKLKAPIDILVSNAGISLHENTFLNVTPESFDKQFNTNFRAGYFLAQAYIKLQLNQKASGQILFVTSEAGDQNYDTPYGLTKSSLNSLVGALSRRVYKDGIRVNAIAPGVTVSDMTKEYAIVEDGNYYRKSASDRLFLPEEIAEVACFLMSDAAQCISGEILHCNDGNHLNPFWEA
ncbi:MAG: SDR family oxidoreductase [Lactobacillaceae bacterium]|nr:SDR family oxidoreductase [Lactobacillaceae bacterium]